MTVAGGDDQQAEQGQDFAEALQARVVRSGATASAGTEVEFRIEDGSLASTGTGGIGLLLAAATGPHHRGPAAL
ncbi:MULTISPECIES: hypothetical protein [Streptomyces]|uniref:Uncharacterized protein n=1 Tax=Streptomyces labedae TaxID=285569 RepID=A0ABP6R4F7_9ACTN|nr:MULTISPECIES: hypothetical protein [unclassified Streptomyces]MDH3038419.1 hypothetical protein [Streptomyces sp. TRM75561]